MGNFAQIALKRALPVLMVNKLLFFCIYKYTKNECVVDVGYTVGHLLAGIVYANSLGDLASLDTRIKLLLVTLWCVRLAGFLFQHRILKGYHDPRYEVVFKKYPAGTLRREFAVLGQYIFQGFIVLITSSPLYFLFQNKLAWKLADLKGPALFNYVSLGVALLGIVLEGIADNQLQKYKESKTKKPNDIFQGGLWKKSRHPNLFFELLTWTSFAAGGVQNLSSLPAFIGPLSLFLVMDRLTVPLTEGYMKKSRGDKYVEFMKRTNKYFPL